MLIAMAGLPGSGKSTVAEAVGGALSTPVVSVDPIESAILSAGIDADQPTGLAAYLVAEALADGVLATTGSVVVDAVNAVTPAREQWTALAARRGVPVVFLEVVCSDRDEHPRRLEARHRDIPLFEEVGWHRVEETLDEWEEWTGPSAAAPRIRLDSMLPADEVAAAALAFVRR